MTTITIKGWMTLTVLWRRSLSYRNQSIDLQSKLLDWFLYDRDLSNKRVKQTFEGIIYFSSFQLLVSDIEVFAPAYIKLFSIPVKISLFTNFFLVVLSKTNLFIYIFTENYFLLTSFYSWQGDVILANL